MQARNPVEAQFIAPAPPGSPCAATAGDGCSVPAWTTRRCPRRPDGGCSMNRGPTQGMVAEGGMMPIRRLNCSRAPV